MFLSQLTVEEHLTEIFVIYILTSVVAEPWWTAKLYHTAHSLPLLKIRGWEKIIEKRSAVEEDGNYSFVISHGQNGFSVEKLIQFIDDYYKNRAMKN